MRTNHEPRTIYIEYCINCSEHQWYTHHNEEKYLFYFHKLSKFLFKQFPEFTIVGNQVPQHYRVVEKSIGKKNNGDQGSQSNQNPRYFDTISKKMIVFPDVGAFEVTFQGKLLFSKKAVNAWPDFQQVRHSIIKTLEEQHIKNTKKIEAQQIQSNQKNNEQEVMRESHFHRDSDNTERQTITFTSKFIENDDKRTTFHKPKQHHNFTLTDHFKLYKMQRQKQSKLNERLPRKYDLSQPGKKTSKRQKSNKNSKSNNKDWEQLSFKGFGSAFKNQIPQFLKNKGQLRLQKGNKQMVINLDSIEQENLTSEHLTSRKDNISNFKKNNLVMKQWDDDLNYLENRFEKFEKKINKINKKKQQIDLNTHKLEQEWFNKIKNKQNQSRVEPHWNNNFVTSNNQEKQLLLENITRKQIGNSGKKQDIDLFKNVSNPKSNRIDEYLRSNENDKNRKLHQIYGQWKVLKKPHYVRRKKMRNNLEHNISEQSNEEQQSEKQKQPKKKNNKIKLESIAKKQGSNQYFTQRKQPLKGLKFRDSDSKSYNKFSNKPNSTVTKWNSGENKINNDSQSEEQDSIFSLLSPDNSFNNDAQFHQKIQKNKKFLPLVKNKKKDNIDKIRQTRESNLHHNQLKEALKNENTSHQEYNKKKMRKYNPLTKDNYNCDTREIFRQKQMNNNKSENNKKQKQYKPNETSVKKKMNKGKPENNSQSKTKEDKKIKEGKKSIQKQIKKDANSKQTKRALENQQQEIRQQSLRVDDSQEKNDTDKKLSDIDNKPFSQNESSNVRSQNGQENQSQGQQNGSNLDKIQKDQNNQQQDSQNLSQTQNIFNKKNSHQDNENNTISNNQSTITKQRHQNNHKKIKVNDIAKEDMKNQLNSKIKEDKKQEKNRERGQKVNKDNNIITNTQEKFEKTHQRNISKEKINNEISPSKSHQKQSKTAPIDQEKEGKKMKINKQQQQKAMNMNKKQKDEPKQRNNIKQKKGENTVSNNKKADKINKKEANKEEKSDQNISQQNYKFKQSDKAGDTQKSIKKVLKPSEDNNIRQEKAQIAEQKQRDNSQKSISNDQNYSKSDNIQENNSKQQQDDKNQQLPFNQNEQQAAQQKQITIQSNKNLDKKQTVCKLQRPQNKQKQANQEQQEQQKKEIQHKIQTNQKQHTQQKPKKVESKLKTQNIKDTSIKSKLKPKQTKAEQNKKIEKKIDKNQKQKKQNHSQIKQNNHCEKGVQKELIDQSKEKDQQDKNLQEQLSKQLKQQKQIKRQQQNHQNEKQFSQNRKVQQKHIGSKEVYQKQGLNKVKKKQIPPSNLINDQNKTNKSEILYLQQPKNRENSKQINKKQQNINQNKKNQEKQSNRQRDIERQQEQEQKQSHRKSIHSKQSIRNEEAEEKQEHKQKQKVNQNSANSKKIDAEDNLQNQHNKKETKKLQMDNRNQTQKIIFKQQQRQKQLRKTDQQLKESFNNFNTVQNKEEGQKNESQRNQQRQNSQSNDSDRDNIGEEDQKLGKQDESQLAKKQEKMLTNNKISEKQANINKINDQNIRKKQTLKQQTNKQQKIKQQAKEQLDKQIINRQQVKQQSAKQQQSNRQQINKEQIKALQKEKKIKQNVEIQKENRQSQNQNKENSIKKIGNKRISSQQRENQIKTDKVIELEDYKEIKVLQSEQDGKNKKETRQNDIIKEQEYQKAKLMYKQHEQDSVDQKIVLKQSQNFREQEKSTKEINKGKEIIIQEKTQNKDKSNDIIESGKKLDQNNKLFEKQQQENQSGKNNPKTSKKPIKQKTEDTNFRHSNKKITQNTIKQHKDINNVSRKAVQQKQIGKQLQNAIQYQQQKRRQSHLQGNQNQGYDEESNERKLEKQTFSNHKVQEDSIQQKQQVRQSMKSSRRQKRYNESKIKSRRVSNVITESKPAPQRKFSVEMVSVAIQKNETEDFSVQVIPDTHSFKQQLKDKIDSLKNDNDHEKPVQKLKQKQKQQSQQSDKHITKNQQIIKQPQTDINQIKTKLYEKISQFSDDQKTIRQQKIAQKQKEHKQKLIADKHESSQPQQNQHIEQNQKTKQKQQIVEYNNNVQKNTSRVSKSQSLEKQKSEIFNQSKFTPELSHQSARLSQYQDFNHGQQHLMAPIRKQLYGQQHENQKKVADKNLNQRKSNLTDFSLAYKSKFEKWISVFDIDSFSSDSMKDSKQALIPLFKENKIFGQKAGSKSSQNEPIGFNLNNLKSFIKLLKIIQNVNPFIISKIFQQKVSSDNIKRFGIWICEQYIWKCYIIDDKIPVTHSNLPSNTVFNSRQDQQAWLYLLEKVLAISLGGYEQLQNVSIGKLFHMVTGTNILSYKIREDHQKNQKVYSTIKSCLGKNFVIYCENSYSNTLMKKNRRQSSVFIITKIKKIDHDQTVIQLEELLYGRSNQKIWIKAEKFVQEFKQIEILQTRLNFNCSRIPIKNIKSHVNIISLDFTEQSEEGNFGSIILSNQNKKGFLRASLYRQGTENVLKLVGQAKEKSKMQLFFDCMFHPGKYYLFAETQFKGSSVTYFGEGFPPIKCKQQVSVDGYKNDFTQYLPISKLVNHEKENIQKNTMTRIPGTDKFMRSAQKFHKGSENKKKQQDLATIRENFIQFLLKGQQQTLKESK